MVKHTQTIRCQKPTNCLRVFDSFVGLALKELKADSEAVFFCEFCEIFKNNYFLEHIRTAASKPFLIGIWKFPYLRYLRFTLWKCTVFSGISALIHFKLVLQFCTTSGEYLEPCQKSMIARFCEYS